jgi:hypothetical protein
MTNIQIIEELCALLEQETELVMRLSFQLSQFTELADADKAEIEELGRKKARLEAIN